LFDLKIDILLLTTFEFKKLQLSIDELSKNSITDKFTINLKKKSTNNEFSNKFLKNSIIDILTNKFYHDMIKVQSENFETYYTVVFIFCR